jgi:hypothetical protein
MPFERPKRWLLVSTTDDYGTAKHVSTVDTLHNRRPRPEVRFITCGRSVAVLADPWTMCVQQPSSHKYVGDMLCFQSSSNPW